MRTKRRSGPVVEATVGYAAGSRGNGVAYAQLTGAGVEALYRVPFSVGVPPPFSDRAIDYAALTAVSHALCKRGFREVRFLLGDPELAQEIASGADVGETLVLPYVRLRCSLNSFAMFDVGEGTADDLTQRARAEVALNVAA
jgi:hypothetical protein